MNATLEPPLAQPAVDTSASTRSWASVLTIAAGTFLLVTTEFMPIGLLGQIANGLQISDGVAGLAVTVPGVVAAIAAPLLTIGAGRLDRRIVLALLSAAIIVSNLVAAFAPNLAVLLAGRVLLGLAVAGFWTFAIAAGRRLVPESLGARATAIISAGVSIGTVLGVPAGALVGNFAGWRSAFVMTAIAGAVVLVAQLALLPTLPVKERVSAGQMLALFKVPKARIGLIATLFIAAGHFTAYTYLEPFLRAVPNAGAATTTAVLLVYGIAGLAGTFLAERLIATGLRRAFVAATLLVGASILAAAALGTHGAWAYVFVALWGLAFGAIPVVIPVWMYEAAPDAYESGSAIVVTAFQTSLASGAFVGGLLVDTSGIGGAFALGGALALTTAFVVGAFGGARAAGPKLAECDAA